MQQRETDISEQAFRALIRTWGLFRGRMTPYFARFGISGAQWGILRQLHRAEQEGHDGLRLSDLGKRLLVRPPSVTNLVDRLERAGLVARSTAIRDQRAKHVKMTGAGRELVARVLRQHPAQIREVLAGLNDDEQRELHDLMTKLGEHLQSLQPEAAKRQTWAEESPPPASDAATRTVSERVHTRGRRR